MASAVSISSSPAAATMTAIYGPVPAGKTLVFNIRACNRGAAALVRLGVHTGTIATADMMEFDAILPAAGTSAPLLNTGEIALAGQTVSVYADTSTVSFRLSGFLKDDA